MPPRAAPAVERHGFAAGGAVPAAFLHLFIPIIYNFNSFIRRMHGSACAAGAAGPAAPFFTAPVYRGRFPARARGGPRAGAGGLFSAGKAPVFCPAEKCLRFFDFDVKYLMESTEYIAVFCAKSNVFHLIFTAKLIFVTQIRRGRWRCCKKLCGAFWR